MTTFPTAEPPTTQHDIRRFIIVGVLWGVAFLFLFALVAKLLGLPTE